MDNIITGLRNGALILAATICIVSVMGLLLPPEIASLAIFYTFILIFSTVVWVIIIKHNMKCKNQENQKKGDHYD